MHPADRSLPLCARGQLGALSSVARYTGGDHCWCVRSPLPLPTTLASLDGDKIFMRAAAGVRGWEETSPPITKTIDRRCCPACARQAL